MPDPLYHRTFDAASLLRDHPPQLRHPHKRALFELADPPRLAAAGPIEVTRWAAEPPASIALPPRAADVRPDFYDYAPVDPAAAEWHVNFADPRLFVAYGSGLFAQDEMQVAEHPLLMCVREAIVAESPAHAKTAGREGSTPVLVRGVERRLAIATDASAAEGRPLGLYGNRFAAAPFEAVRRATRILSPPTVTNLIAIAAPAGGEGEYAASEIAAIFVNAYTGFAAAVRESSGRSVVVHTGFWGCGAFGGDRVLMVALQTLAARAAGVARIVLHTGDATGAVDARRGIGAADTIAAACRFSATLVTFAAAAAALGRHWGRSDGN